MTDLLDLIGKVALIFVSAIPVMLSFRNSRLTRRATEAETQTDLLDQFNKQADRAVEQDNKLRLERETTYQQSLEIRQFKIDKARDAADKAAAALEIARLQKINSELGIGSGEQAKTIASLVASVDGMPKLITQQMGQILLDKAFKELLRQALVEAGMAREDQPVEQPPEPLTDLEPKDLLNQLAQEKDARDAATPAPDSPPAEDKPAGDAAA